MNTTADKLNYLTETKNAIKTAITAKGGAVNDAMPFREYANAIMSIPQEGGGGGSGIIDVTELPTENIDENAVYRVTESYKAKATDIYVVFPNEDTHGMRVMTLFEATGTNYNIYIVDEFPADMKVLNPETSTELEIYVLTTDGIGYVNILGMGIVPLGLLLFEQEGLDKGYTNNPYAEIEMGVYTVVESYGQYEKWFIRESGEWKEITAHFVEVSLIGGKNVESLTGDYTGEPLEVTDSRSEIDIVDKMIKDKVIPSKIIVKTPLISDCVSKEIYQVPKKWFLTESGDYIDYVRAGLFMGCTSLRDIELPENTIEIEDYAFYNCSALRLTSLPDYVGLIGEHAFYSCRGLRLTNLPENVETIKHACFSNCINLELTSLPQNLYRIEYQAFYGCINLKLTSLPERLKVVDGAAFYNCRNLALTSLPQSLEEIGGSAFSSCTGLTTITFKSKPTLFGYAVFEQCDNLTTINVPWSEGEVSGAPWGATNATINYNYTGE